MLLMHYDGPMYAENKHKLAEAFGNTTVQLGFEKKYFPETLANWMAEEGCDNKSAEFLQKVGLGNVVSPEAFEAILYGQAIPSRRFIGVLSVALPGQLLHPDHRLSGVNTYFFRRNAKTWCRSHRHLPIMDLDPVEYAAFRQETLRGFSKNAHVPHSQPSAQNDPENAAERALSTYATSIGKDPIAFIELLLAHYRDAPEPVLQTMSRILKESGVNISDSKLDSFLRSHHPKTDLPMTSLGLSFLRQCETMEHHHLVNRSRFDQHTAIEIPSLSSWECGIGIPQQRLGHLIKGLALSGDDALWLANAIYPSLLEKTGPEWLHQKIEQQQWSFLSYPALDPQWLEKQDPEKQAGLLLRALRHRIGKSSRDVAKELEVHGATITRYEDGTRHINPHSLGMLIKSLSPRPREAEQLAERINPELLAYVGPEWLHEQIANQQWETISYPALSTSWRNALPTEQQGARLLDTIATQKNLTKEAVFAALGITKERYKQQLEGKAPIDVTTLPTFSHVAKLSPPMAQLLTTTAEDSNRVIAFSSATVQLGATATITAMPMLATTMESTPPGTRR